jgi:hypothetical protein
MQGLEHALQKVCEECEELLVEAGRKFRLALSLDRMDMRALYNWGLALCHRAQLISEEGMKVGFLFRCFVESIQIDDESMLELQMDSNCLGCVGTELSSLCW